MLKTKNLRGTEDRFSNSILSARLISVLDFIFCSFNDAARRANFQAQNDRNGRAPWVDSSTAAKRGCAWARGSQTSPT